MPFFERILGIGKTKLDFKLLLDAIRDPFFICDLEETIIQTSPQLEEVFGFAQPILGQKVWKVFSGTDVPDAVRQVGSDAHKLDFGGERYFSLRVSRLRDPDDETRVLAVIVIFHDISDLKRADRVRIDFVANVSHELRTPLTSIKGYADTIAADLAAGQPVDAAFVGAIQRNADRLMDLVHDLLDLSALESHEALALEIVSTREITDRVVTGLRKNIEEKRQTLVVDLEVDSVRADPKRLEQVLVNLLDNACKYTPPERELRIVWEMGAGGGSSVLKVIDQGPGIPAEHHARLFERFYRVDRARSRELGGTGLGLAIVKHIVGRHGGSVWVESSVGQGSTFACRFPG